MKTDDEKRKEMLNEDDALIMRSLMQAADPHDKEWQHVSAPLGDVTVSGWIMLPEQEE